MSQTLRPSKDLRIGFVLESGCLFSIIVIKSRHIRAVATLSAYYYSSREFMSQKLTATRQTFQITPKLAVNEEAPTSLMFEHQRQTDLDHSSTFSLRVGPPEPSLIDALKTLLMASRDAP